MFRKSILILLAALAFGCQNRPPLLRSAAEEDIREVVYRYQFDHNASGLKHNAGAYFLRIGNSVDPSPAFIYRFRENVPPVKKASMAVVSPSEGVRDRESGARGIIFHTGEIRWLGRGEVEVKGGYYEAGLSASENSYLLMWQGGEWVVVKDKLISIS